MRYTIIDRSARSRDKDSDSQNTGLSSPIEDDDDELFGSEERRDSSRLSPVERRSEGEKREIR